MAAPQPTRRCASPKPDLESPRTCYIAPMKRRSSLRCILFFAVTLLPTAVFGSSQPAAEEQTTPAASLARTVFSRTGSIGPCDGMTIPFVHPERPTVYLESGGVTLPMLFDTGSFLSIFIDDGQFINPGLRQIAAPEIAAAVDGKLQAVGYDDEPSYGLLDLAKLGGVRVRDVPFRIYRNGSNPSRDYAGAIAPVLFRDFIIEVRNSRSEIELHTRSDWGPPDAAAVLPFVALPRGCFVSMRLAEESYWFHLDTGFSGTIGLLPALCNEHPQWLAKGQGDQLTFQGWDEALTCRSLVIPEVSIPPYGDYSWSSSQPLYFSDIRGVEYPRSYDDIVGLSIAGIIGSGFLAGLDYALDYASCRMYILADAR